MKGFWNSNFTLSELPHEMPLGPPLTNLTLWVEGRGGGEEEEGKEEEEEEEGGKGGGGEGRGSLGGGGKFGQHNQEEIVKEGEEEEEEKGDRLQHFKQWVILIVASLGAVPFGAMMAFPSVVARDLDQLPYTYDGSRIALSETQLDLMNSMYILGTASGGLSIFIFMSWIGRIRSVALATVLIIIAWLGVAFLPYYGGILFLRWFGGVGTGAMSAALPTYLSELSRSKVRGTATGLSTLATLVGQLMVFLMGTGSRYYTVALYSVTVPAIYLTLLIVLPESPAYLALKGKQSSAKATLSKLRDRSADIDEEVNRYIAAAAESADAAAGGWRALLLPQFRMPVFVTVLTFVAANFSGGLVVVANASRILKVLCSSVTDDLAAVIVMACQAVSGTLQIILVDRAGRKSTLILSYIVMAVSLTGLTAYVLVLNTTPVTPVAHNTTGMTPPVIPGTFNTSTITPLRKNWPGISSSETPVNNTTLVSGGLLYILKYGSIPGNSSIYHTDIADSLNTAGVERDSGIVSDSVGGVGGGINDVDGGIVGDSVGVGGIIGNLGGVDSGIGGGINDVDGAGGGVGRLDGFADGIVNSVGGIGGIVGNVGGVGGISEDRCSAWQYGWVPVVCLAASQAGVAFGVIPVPFLLANENFPTWIRPRVCSVCIACGSLANIIAMQVFTPLMQVFSLAGVLVSYVVVCVATSVFAMLFVKETMGKQLD